MFPIEVSWNFRKPSSTRVALLNHVFVGDRIHHGVAFSSVLPHPQCCYGRQVLPWNTVRDLCDERHSPRTVYGQAIHPGKGAALACAAPQVKRPWVLQVIEGRGWECPTA